MGKVDMARIIIIIAALIIGLYLWRWLRGEYQKKGRPFAVKTALVTTAGLLIALAATGRVHWVGAFLASGLAALRFALPLLMRGRKRAPSKIRATKRRTHTPSRVR